ncbi:MAG: hypothetical protein KC900_11025 [Candidatus Omnitrophica bacterium]|nr:hypothetical protein [Candidatus Omnitrophota bacterium]
MVFGQSPMAQGCQTLKIALLGVLLCVSVAEAASDPLLTHPVFSRQQQSLRQDILRIIEQVRSDHRVGIEFENLDPDDIDQTQISLREAAPKDYGRVYRFLLLLQEELNKYPPNFLRPAQLESIYLVKSLFREDKNAQGIYDYRHKIIFFDFARQYGGEMAQRHNIHHEFFHVIDTNSFYWQEKVGWEELNASDFEYVRKGKVHVDPEPNQANYFAPTRKGFVTYYAMMSPYEDKAEVFACLFVRSQSRLIQRWAAKDDILQKKISYLKQFLNIYTDGTINEDYFTRLWAASER